MIPLHPDTHLAYALAVAFGFAFGFVLERAGFADARRLAAQFYLSDMRVLKVMFSAVVTAALGIALLRSVGVLDWDAVYVNPTYLGGQLAGGALFGVGFVLSGHCPGTAVVSCASGRLNGLVFLAGVMLGALAFAAVDPWLAPFAQRGGERITLDQWLGISFGGAVALVTAMALGLFALAEWTEAAMARRHHEPRVVAPRARRMQRALFATALGLAMVAWVFHGQDGARALPQAHRVAEVAPYELARSIREGSPQEVIWLAGRTRHALVGSAVSNVETLSDAQLLDLAGARRVLLAFADVTRMNRVARALSASGHDVRVLSGGLEAWDRALDVAPEPPAAGASAAAWAAHRERVALRAFFTGARPLVPEVAPRAPVPVAASTKKREGC